MCFIAGISKVLNNERYRAIGCVSENKEVWGSYVIEVLQQCPSIFKKVKIVPMERNRYKTVL